MPTDKPPSRKRKGVSNYINMSMIRKFDYKFSENPRIITYIYGSVIVVRPITLVTKNGNLVNRFECGAINIAKTEIEKDILNGLDCCDLDIITNDDFDKKLIDKHIINKVRTI